MVNIIVDLKPQIVTIPEGVTTDTFRKYNFMEGNSPYFDSTEELMEYYKQLPILTRIKHIIDFDMLVIYVHEVASKDLTLSHGYNAKKGEVLSTDEHSIYSYKEKCWL